MQHDITPRPGHFSNRFLQPATAPIARRFPWHILSKQRSCPLITGFSSIRVWVTQPRHQLRRLGNKWFYQASGEAQNPCCLYKGIRTPFRTHAFFFPIHSPSPELHRPSVRLLCPQRPSENVRIRSRRQVDGFYRPREGYQKASGGRVPGQENQPPSPDGGIDRPHSGTPREGCIPPSLCPRARVSPPPVRSRHHVLLWDRFS